MKVLCIDTGLMMNCIGETLPAPMLIEGEVYTVINITKVGGYELAEAKTEPRYHGFNPKRFAPLSNIDEKEFERNYIKEPINQ